MKVQLVHNTGAVIFDGFRADEQLFGDLAQYSPIGKGDTGVHSRKGLQESSLWRCGRGIGRLWPWYETSCGF